MPSAAPTVAHTASPVVRRETVLERQKEWRPLRKKATLAVGGGSPRKLVGRGKRLEMRHSSTTCLSEWCVLNHVATVFLILLLLPFSSLISVDGQSP